MNQPKLIQTDTVSDNFLADLDRREAVLWLRSLPETPLDLEELVRFVGLPWRMVLLEVSEPDLVKALEGNADADDPMARKRGFMQVVDNDPSKIELPQRCLPVYLLNGRQGSTEGNFQSRYRRMAMLEELRRSEVRQIVIVSGDQDPVPPELEELWSSGFRSFLTFATDARDGPTVFENSISEVEALNAATLLRSSVGHTTSDILTRFARTYPEEVVVIRLRDRSGAFSTFDVTVLDDPERPVLDYYDIIQERDLAMLAPDQLTEEEFVSFFENPDVSWVPYAAGLPWERDDQAKRRIARLVEKLDAVGPEENCIAYLTAEPGAGGTTLARALAWGFAQEGYPVLVAKVLPFVPDALSLANFLNRVRIERENADSSMPATEIVLAKPDENGRLSSGSPRYEVPWIIVFDRLHWEYHGTELRRFRNEMEQQGRPVCLLVVSGPIREMSYFDTSVFHEIGEVNHALDHEEARALGRHLNQFLRNYGKVREDWQWDQFYQEHSIRYLEGISAFWVTLSFWIQGQYDLTESVQEWMYRCFKERVKDETMQSAILEIAALSSERLPTPDGLLPRSPGKWPVSHLLEDIRSNLGPLGLIRFTAAGEKYWALVHDILGRFLITALFYDFPTREEMGFGDAKDPEHLRFLLLRQISSKQELGETSFREIGDNFATTIFKTDPDHGHGAFTSFWREVLGALDAMPRPLQDSSRVFRHHTAVSRRRIAKQDEKFYGVTSDDRTNLLNRAIQDLKYALEAINYSPGSEPNLNLYNSLAHAYHDLADAEESTGATEEVVNQLRKLANDATRRAYEENPSNSFVIETYVRDLLTTARSNSDSAVQLCVEAMGILFSAISSNEKSYRKAQLGGLADKALGILFEHAPKRSEITEPSDPIEVLTRAWVVLADGVDCTNGTALSELPEQNRINAIEVLSHPAGLGNMQVIHLSYDMTSSAYPYEYKRQIEYLEQLKQTGYHVSPQIRVEYAILLYQAYRPKEGDVEFRNLRKLWRESEQFVGVPGRLRFGEPGAEAVAIDEERRLAAGLDEQHPTARSDPPRTRMGDPRLGLRFDNHDMRDATRFGTGIGSGAVRTRRSPPL